MKNALRAVRTRGLLPLFLLLAAALLPCGAAAQDTIPAPAAPADSLFEVRLSDGSVLYGRVLEQTPEELVVQTESGATVRVPRGQIASMEVLRGRVVRGQVWPEDRNTSRLFFAPTGRAVPAGDGYLGVYELVFPFLTYGVTDRLTISAGTPIIPELIGQVFYLAPKLEVLRTPGVNAAVGVLALFVAGDDFGGSAGLLYGVGTFGDSDRALTVGATLPFSAADGDSEISGDPVFMVGGEKRLSRRLKFITENYAGTSLDDAVVSGGLRFLGERLSADFGLVTTLESGYPYPLVNFVYSF